MVSQPLVTVEASKKPTVIDLLKLSRWVQLNGDPQPPDSFESAFRLALLACLLGLAFAKRWPFTIGWDSYLPSFLIMKLNDNFS